MNPKYTISFSKWIYLLSPHSRCGISPYQSPSLSRKSSLLWFFFFFGYAFYILYIHRIILYVLFGTWVILPSTLLKFIHVTCVSSLFFYSWVVFHCTNTLEFILSPVDGHLDLYQFLALMNKTAGKILICLFMDRAFNFSWSGI